MALAIYFLMSQSLGTKRSAQAMVVWGMGFAGLFWSLVLPIWNFPTEIFTTEINLQGRFSDYSAPGWLLIAFPKITTPPQSPSVLLPTGLFDVKTIGFI